MRKKLIVLLLMISSISNAETIRRTVVKVLPKMEVEGKFDETKAILNYIKKEGYIQKSNIRKTTDSTMEESVKEIDAEKNGVTYTLFLKADEQTRSVVIVDTSILEYYDILENVRKEHNRIMKIEAVTYARGIDINLYPKEHLSSEEIRIIGSEIANKIRNSNSVSGKITLIIYDSYDHNRILHKDNF